jgi:8-oxo-dGTP pyrophosphatase MutT (NUDIX family)
MLREVYKETWLDISSAWYKKLYRRYFYYHGTNISLEMYYVKYSKKPKIVLSEEHNDYIWVSPKESLQMSLVEDWDVIISELYKI